VISKSGCQKLLAKSNEESVFLKELTFIKVFIAKVVSPVRLADGHVKFAIKWTHIAESVKLPVNATVKCSTVHVGIKSPHPRKFAVGKSKGSKPAEKVIPIPSVPKGKVAIVLARLIAMESGLHPAQVRLKAK